MIIRFLGCKENLLDFIEIFIKQRGKIYMKRGKKRRDIERAVTWKKKIGGVIYDVI